MFRFLNEWMMNEFPSFSLALLQNRSQVAPVPHPRCNSLPTFAQQCSSSHSFCSFAWEARSTVNRNANHAEFVDVGAQQGVVWESSVMESGVKTWKRPAGLFKKKYIWVRWWRDACAPRVRHCTLSCHSLEMQAAIVPCAAKNCCKTSIFWMFTWPWNAPWSSLISAYHTWPNRTMLNSEKGLIWENPNKNTAIFRKIVEYYDQSS